MRTKQKKQNKISFYLNNFHNNKIIVQYNKNLSRIKIKPNKIIQLIIIINIIMNQNKHQKIIK
jgi:5-enolpyruvylshikimate-3-phosphate synthase